MCMIAHRPVRGKRRKGANMPNVVIDTAITRHPDGFGIAWRENGKLRYEKFGPTEKAEFRTLLKAVDARRDIEYVTHFRFATHGPECKALAHPFRYEDESAGTVLVFHNGIINAVKPTKAESDTEVFVRDILAKLPSRWWDNKAIRALVDASSGWSRIVLMTHEETVNLNFDQGEEDGGLWYSSNHKPYTYTSTVKYSASGGTYKGYDYAAERDWEAEGWEYEGTGWTNKRDSILATQGAFGTAALADAPKVTIKAVLSPKDTTHPRQNTDAWTHMGHLLRPLQEFDFKVDGDYEASVQCQMCDTNGDVFVIDGKAYVDIDHVRVEDEPDWLVPDEQEDLLPERGSTRALTVVH